MYTIAFVFTRPLRRATTQIVTAGVTDGRTYGRRISCPRKRRRSLIREGEKRGGRDEGASEWKRGRRSESTNACIAHWRRVASLTQQCPRSSIGSYLPPNTNKKQVLYCLFKLRHAPEASKGARWGHSTSLFRLSPISGPDQSARASGSEISPCHQTERQDGPLSPGAIKTAPPSASVRPSLLAR